jgi:hypothetical protein
MQRDLVKPNQSSNDDLKKDCAKHQQQKRKTQLACAAVLVYQLTSTWALPLHNFPSPFLGAASPG